MSISSIFTNFAVPLFTMIFAVSLFFWFLFLCWKGFKFLFPNLIWIVKYKIFRRPFAEETVEWCLEAIRRKYSLIQIEKALWLKGNKRKQVKETLYIYHQVQKALKGGDKNGR